MASVEKQAAKGDGATPPPGASIISINGLGYAYRGHENAGVLQEIDLDIEPGSFVVVMGRTGSGKSTLCLALNGLIPKSFGGRFEGRVTIGGLDTSEVEMADLARIVGIVQQNPESQLIGLTVAEDVEFGLENLAMPPDEIVDRSRRALDAVGLSDLLSRSPWRLSGGQKQRLAIASALAFDPRILVLDNPTAELDPVGRLEVLRTISALNREHGITIVMVATDLYEVGPHADRVVVLEEGRIAFDGSVREALAAPTRLRSLGVKVPDLVQLADALNERGIWPGDMPASVDEAEQVLRSRLTAIPSAAAAVPDRDTTEPLVVFDKVRFGYPGGPEVLRGVDLTIGTGEFVAIMGANGAGKSTIGKNLNGLLKPTSGTVRVAGKDTAGHSIAELAADVGYVFQNPDHQIVRRTLAEEFALGPEALGWPEAEVKEAVERSLDFLGFGGPDTDPFFLGLAERNLVALATALIMRPRILVLDEPATGADHAVITKLMQRVEELNREGLTLVMVTHDASIVAEHARRLVVVKEGKIAYDGAPEEVFSIGDALRASQITAPPVMELSTRLADLGVPAMLKVDEAVRNLAGRMRRA